MTFCTVLKHHLRVQFLLLFSSSNQVNTKILLVSQAIATAVGCVCVCIHICFYRFYFEFFFLLYSRCNLPPVTGNATKDVGSKTNLVTVNPSIITLRWVPASCVAPQNPVWSRHTFLPLLLRLTCPTAEPGKQNRRHPQSWTLTQAGLCRKNDF